MSNNLQQRPSRWSAQPEVHFQCAVCLEIKSGKPIPVPNDGQICTDCFEDSVKADVENAIKFEHAYPVKWGGEVLDLSQYAEQLPDSSLAQYAEKEKEYSLANIARLYCAGHSSDSGRCNKFLGARQTLPEAVQCTICAGTTCNKCEGLVESSTHTCAPKTAPADPLEGLTRGQDYQICPGCKTVIELESGCNHMTCSRDNTSFCFLCGARARPGDKHWFEGKPCPRYGRPGEGAIFDPDYGEDDNNDRLMRDFTNEIDDIIFEHETDGQLDIEAITQHEDVTQLAAEMNVDLADVRNWVQSVQDTLNQERDQMLNFLQAEQQRDLQQPNGGDFLSTDRARQRHSLRRELIRTTDYIHGYMERVSAENVPDWLEATLEVATGLIDVVAFYTIWEAPLPFGHQERASRMFMRQIGEEIGPRFQDMGRQAGQLFPRVVEIYCQLAFDPPGSIQY